MTKKYWTEEETKLFKEVYPNMFSEEVAKIFNCNVRQVYNYASKIKIKKSIEWQRQELQRQAIRLKFAGINQRFKPGQIPPNKGQKMDADQYQKCKVTFFAKGNEPHNTKWDGYERVTVDDYVEVRISKGKFKMKHRLIWEQAYGPMPKGTIIIFKDKNRRNFALDNLEAITLKENMERNRMTKYPPELRNLIKLNNKLKKKLNEKQD